MLVLCVYLRPGMFMVFSTSCKRLLRSQLSFRSSSKRRKGLSNSLPLMAMIIMGAAMSWRFWGISAWLACSGFIVFWGIIILVSSACFPSISVSRVFTPVLLAATLQPFITMVLPILCSAGRDSHCLITCVAWLCCVYDMVTWNSYSSFIMLVILVVFTN